MRSHLKIVRWSRAVTNSCKEDLPFATKLTRNSCGDTDKGQGKESGAGLLKPPPFAAKKSSFAKRKSRGAKRRREKKVDYSKPSMGIKKRTTGYEKCIKRTRAWIADQQCHERRSGATLGKTRLEEKMDDSYGQTL